MSESFETADVLIVGGGPAGSVAALCLKHRLPEIKVVILDAATFPRDKACGDAVGPGAVRVLRRLQLDDELFADSERVSQGRVVGPDGIEFVARFDDGTDDPHGYIQPRMSFDANLLGACTQRGVIVEQGCKVTALARTSTAWNASAQSVDIANGHRSTWSTRILVGADGASSLVRKVIGLPPLHGRSRALAIRAYAKWGPSGRRLDEHELLVVYEPRLAPIYGWVFPLPDGSVNVGAGYLEVDRDRGDRNLRRQLDAFVQYLRSIGFDLTSLRDIASHPLPLGNNKHLLARDQAFLIGDAAGMINPLSGEGIAYSARAAEILAEELTPSGALIASGGAADAERAYGKRFRSEFRTHFRQNYWATRLLSKRLLGTTIFRAAQRSGAVRAHGVNLMFGDAKVDPKSLYLVARGLFGGDRGSA